MDLRAFNLFNMNDLKNWKLEHPISINFNAGQSVIAQLPPLVPLQSHEKHAFLIDNRSKCFNPLTSNELTSVKLRDSMLICFIFGRSIHDNSTVNKQAILNLLISLTD